MVNYFDSQILDGGVAVAGEVAAPGTNRQPIDKTFEIEHLMWNAHRTENRNRFEFAFIDSKLKNGFVLLQLLRRFDPLLDRPRW